MPRHTSFSDTPLQNRVDPFGEVVAVAARGTMFGNRGGKFHEPATGQLRRRHWASRAWICCVLDYTPKNGKPLRTTEVMGPGRYTELFFLDEATALAAGHRPCFQCRHSDALRFREAFVRGNPDLGLSSTTPVDNVDRVLHDARLDGSGKRTFDAETYTLADGTFVTFPGDARTPWLRWQGSFYRWSFEGYDPAAASTPPAVASVLTPAPTVNALRAGYLPAIHHSLVP